MTVVVVLRGQQCINNSYSQLCNKTVFAGRYTNLTSMTRLPDLDFEDLCNTPIHYKNQRSHQ